MATITKFEDLEIWKLAREQAKAIHELTRTNGFAKDFDLKNQINASAGSVMDNIAEGFERFTNKEFSQFLVISKGSNGELRSQLYRAFDKNYISEDILNIRLDFSILIGNKTKAFIDYLKSDLLSGDPYRETRAAGSVVVAAAGLLALGKGVVDVARKARLATRAARDAKLTEEAPAGVPQPAQLAAGMKEELRSLAALGVEKNTAIWRPDKAMMASTLFRVVVGNPKFTMKGRPVGTIIDAAGLEIKAGTSPLEASYQLRLQVYRSIVTGDSLTILTSRPLTGSFSRYLDRWGVTVGDLP
jgi:four helix bundle protein